MGKRYKIVLPYPDRDLGPNRSRNVHWTRKAKLVREYRAEASLTIRLNYHPTELFQATTLNAQATFYCKDKRKRDRTNLSAMLKPAWDGFQDAGLIEDDCGIIEHPCEINYDKNNPRVEVELWT